MLPAWVLRQPRQPGRKLSRLVLPAVMMQLQRRRRCFHKQLLPSERPTSSGRESYADPGACVFLLPGKEQKGLLLRGFCWGESWASTGRSAGILREDSSNRSDRSRSPPSGGFRKLSAALPLVLTRPQGDAFVGSGGDGGAAGVFFLLAAAREARLITPGIDIDTPG